MDGEAGDLPEYVTINRRHWDLTADQWVAGGERGWAEEPVWGMWHVPEAEVRMLPDDMTSLDAVELGCGTGYVSAWMARRGATVTGIDNSARQLATARRLADEHGVDLRLIHGNAETVPCPDASFDVAISEYGAAIWCDPYAWVPEAHRLLRPGGSLLVLGHTPLAMACMPVDGSIPCRDTLQRDYFGMHRLPWDEIAEEPACVEFNLPISAWFRLFRETGFDIVDFVELQAPASGAEVNYFVTADWARRFPSEQVWKLRRR
jgi:SAM-dependent methyltransferase